MHFVTYQTVKAVLYNFNPICNSITHVNGLIIHFVDPIIRTIIGLKRARKKIQRSSSPTDAEVNFDTYLHYTGKG